MPTQGQLCVNSNQPDGHDCKLLADYPRPASKHGFLTARDANKAVETRKASSSSNVEFPMQPHATHAALRNEFNFESELNEVVAGSWRHSRHCHFKNIDGARIFSCSTLLVYVFCFPDLLACLFACLLVCLFACLLGCFFSCLLACLACLIVWCPLAVLPSWAPTDDLTNMAFIGILLCWGGAPI